MTAGFPSALPAPRLPDPMTVPPLRWGVLGTGWIAERFTGSLQRNTNQRVVAVGSRSSSTARAAAETWGVPRGHGGYDDLVADPEVDVVYVATPHNAHFHDALLAIDAGKHVVVEKPLALNAPQAKEIAERARAAGLFCTEAMWTMFLPRLDVVRQMIADGVLGEVRTLLADHGERLPPGHRIHRRDLAGGVLLDLGIYPVSLATAVLGAPSFIAAVGQDAPTGVNGQVGALLQHAGGATSVLSTTLECDTPTTAVIAGTEATLTLGTPFFAPGAVTLAASGGGPVLEWTEPPVKHEALYWTAVETARCVSAGELVSPLHSPAAAVTALSVVDEIRGQLGIVFDEERGAASR